jgi:predicted RNase H-like HicB family nuclease
MKRAYAIVVRRAKTNYSADCPDLPGCVATGRTIDEALRRMRSAMRFHIDGLRAQRLPVPRPTTKLSTLVRERGAEQIYTLVQIAA